MNLRMRETEVLVLTASSVVILEGVTGVVAKGIVLKLNLHNNRIIFTQTLSLPGEDWRPAEMGCHQIPPHSPLKPPLLSEEVTFELRPEGRERAKLEKNGRTSIQGEGTESAKGPGKTADPICGTGVSCGWHWRCVEWGWQRFSQVMQSQGLVKMQ